MQPIHLNTLCQGIGQRTNNPLITSVCTDSRMVQKNSLFVCIKGERTDGHLYAKQALEQGAAMILAQHEIEGVPQEQCMIIEDALDAMIAMGANYRAEFSPVLVGVTGSVGKTTTKEFCYAVFSYFGETIKTQGNQNNEIGMPNTLFQLTENTKYAVVEMGMQGLGEIEKLTKSAKPQGAIITTIGQAHFEQLGSYENILRAKMEICEGLCDGAPLVLSIDNPFLRKAVVPQRLQRVTVGIDRQEAQVRALEITMQEDGTTFVIADKENGVFDAWIPTVGMHHVSDAIAAYALATRLGLDPQQVIHALSGYETTGFRQKIAYWQEVRVMEDCYNASPDSMKAALDVLHHFSQGKRIAVLGDMFELGAIEQEAHRELADFCVQAEVDFLITLGENTKYTHQQAVQNGLLAIHCDTISQAVQILQEKAKAGDTILVKASRGMKLEQLLEQLYQTEKIDFVKN